MKPHAIIEVRFKTTAEGGRQSALVVTTQPFNCPLFVGGKAFDCRFCVKDCKFELGRTYEVPIRFLRPDLVLRSLSAGTPVTLWEGKDIATGEVVRVFHEECD